MKFTKIKHDLNGNPRYVVHFLECTPNSWAHIALSTRYAMVCKLMNTIGGRKYHNKSYGGGIVFQSHCLQGTEAAIISACNKVSLADEYQGWTNSATWSAAYLTQQEFDIYQALSKIRKTGSRVQGWDVKEWFNKKHLVLDPWVKGVVNWDEIADDHYNNQDFGGV